MNEKRFYQIAKYEHSKNSWYHALASFFHKIEIKFRVRGSSNKATARDPLQDFAPILEADVDNDHVGATTFPSVKTSADRGKINFNKRTTLDLKTRMSGNLVERDRQRQSSTT